MNIYIVTFCAFKGFLSKPEIRAELVPSESEEIVRKSAKNVIQQFFLHYARVVFEVQKLDKRKLRGMLSEKAPLDWQTAIGYKDGKSVKT